MRYGFVLPRGDAKTAAALAQEAEAAGWDGFFMWEPVWGIDAWVSLAAAAMKTKTIRLGTMLTPISRMRPWKLASETVTLDHLSDGRVTVAVGLGAVDTGFAAFGEVIERKTRAELMDEGLEILTGLWQGQPFSYEGKHYQVKPTDFAPPPPPLQQPRIPIWVVGATPSEKSLGRVAKYDGWLPSAVRKQPNGTSVTEQATPAEVREGLQWIQSHRTATTPFDVIVEGVTPADDPARSKDMLQEWQDAGATWWLEALWEADSIETVQARVRQGPPRGE